MGPCTSYYGSIVTMKPTRCLQGGATRTQVSPKPTCQHCQPPTQLPKGLSRPQAGFQSVAQRVGWVLSCLQGGALWKQVGTYIPTTPAPLFAGSTPLDLRRFRCK